MNLLDVLKLDNGGVIDTLFKLVHFGPQEDGDLPSKAGFVWLCEQGYATKDYDEPLSNALTRKGLGLFINLTPDEMNVVRTDYPRLQFTNYIRIGYCIRGYNTSCYDKPFILACSEYAEKIAREWMLIHRLYVDQDERELDYWTVKFVAGPNQGNKTLTLTPGAMIMFLERDESTTVYAHAL